MCSTKEAQARCACNQKAEPYAASAERREAGRIRGKKIKNIKVLCECMMRRDLKRV